MIKEFKLAKRNRLLLKNEDLTETGNGFTSGE